MSIAGWREKLAPWGRSRFCCWSNTILKVCTGGLIFGDQLIQSGAAPDALSIRWADHATNKDRSAVVPGPF